MDEKDRKPLRLAEDFLDRARNRVQAPEKHLEPYSAYPDAVASSIESIEFTVKVIARCLLGGYPKEHSFDEPEFTEFLKTLADALPSDPATSMTSLESYSSTSSGESSTSNQSTALRLSEWEQVICSSGRKHNWPCLVRRNASVQPTQSTGTSSTCGGHRLTRFEIEIARLDSQRCLR